MISYLCFWHFEWIFLAPNHFSCSLELQCLPAQCTRRAFIAAENYTWDFAVFELHLGLQCTSGALHTFCTCVAKKLHSPARCPTILSSGHSGFTVTHICTTRLSSLQRITLGIAMHFRCTATGAVPISGLPFISASWCSVTPVCSNREKMGLKIYLHLDASAYSTSLIKTLYARRTSLWFQTWQFCLWCWPGSSSPSPFVFIIINTVLT